MLMTELEKRGLPDIFTCFDGSAVRDLSEWEKRKAELADFFQREIYGYLPEPPAHISACELSRDKSFCAGKADLVKIALTMRVHDTDFTFPVYCTVPKSGVKLTFILINFRPDVPDRYLPSEELIDNGVAVFSFCYKDFATDDGDFTNGLSRILCKNGKRGENDAGKIAMWAWGAMRVMDYVQTLGGIDRSRIVVAGHSRLGKTALLTSALDSRFAGAAVNDSGCMGAAISRGKSGETVKAIYEHFPYWFCPHFEVYARGEALPVDQHCLIAMNAPRRVHVASAALDATADPVSEYLSCVAASDVYKLYNTDGFVHTDSFVTPPTSLYEGNIAYHLRDGAHYFSRTDWLEYLKYFK